MGIKETRRNLRGKKKEEKPGFVLTINFGEETYGASVRGCQNICNTSGLFSKNTFQTDTHWQSCIRTFRGTKNMPGSGFTYIAFACRYQDFRLFLLPVSGVVTTFPFDSRSEHSSYLFLLL